MYSVYKHIIPNGKVYIGITSQTPQARWDNGRGYKFNEYFTNAIKKYGWDNIKHEVLFTNLTKEQAEQKEIELIALYKSNQREYGYNIASGGGVNTHTKETRLKQSNAKLNMREDKKQEWKSKIREAHLGLKMPKRKKETLEKMSKALKGKYISEQNPHSKKVAQIDLATNKIIKIYNATKDVERELGFDNSSIAKVCRGKRLTAYGFKWQYV